MIPLMIYPKKGDHLFSFTYYVLTGNNIHRFCSLLNFFLGITPAVGSLGLDMDCPTEFF